MTARLDCIIIMTTGRDFVPGSGLAETSCQPERGFMTDCIIFMTADRDVMSDSGLAKTCAGQRTGRCFQI